jgi:CheY-like chemotaxis protein
MEHRIVFLVENDEDLRRAMGLLLEKWGISVLDAASGEEALDLIEELGILPDCFIVDHNLGDGMTGLAFLTEVQARHGTVPARIVSADRTPELRAACQAAGIGQLMKPIDARALEQFVAELPAPH